MPPVNKKQAYIIQDSEPLENLNGTAAGIWLETNGRTIVLLPGPPHEIKPMFEFSVLPRLKKRQSGFSARKILKTTGLTESEIESLIHDLQPKSPGIRLTTLAYPGQIEIHLFSHSIESPSAASKPLTLLAEEIEKRLGQNVFSKEGEELEEIIGRLLQQKCRTLSVAESCTGGLVGHRITDVSGSSSYFLQGIVAYSNQAKSDLLGVPSILIEKHGAVSREVARTMAANVRTRANASYGLAITGIAGPTGGTPEKPIGLVYTALSWEREEPVVRNLFLGNREAVKFQSSQKALDMLRRHLLKH